jgi:hypothetical protein
VLLPALLLAASQHSSVNTQEPPPSETRARLDSAADRCDASLPASHNRPASSSAAATATAPCSQRVGGVNAVSSNSTAGSASAYPPTLIRLCNGTPVPDTSRFGATLTKAMPNAAGSAAVTIASSTRL